LALPSGRGAPHLRCLSSGPRQRVHRLGRAPTPAWQPSLSGPGLGPDRLDVHHSPDGSLDAAQLDLLRARLCPVGDEPAGLSPDQCRGARGQCGRLLRCRPATPRPRPARTAERRRRAAQTGRVRRRAIVLGAPAARRVRGLDHGAQKRAVRAVLPARAAGVPAIRRRIASYLPAPPSRSSPSTGIGWTLAAGMPMRSIKASFMWK